LLSAFTGTTLPLIYPTADDNTFKRKKNIVPVAFAGAHYYAVVCVIGRYAFSYF